ncbi:hypothetical protein [Brucella sp. BZ]|uniref:hypothetical protein n=1 Tax=Brucella sp. BZ TaxID=3381346 RepID=UPI0039EAB31D
MVAVHMGILRQTADQVLKTLVRTTADTPTKTPVENNPLTNDTAAILALALTVIIDSRKDINAVTAIIASDNGVNLLPGGAVRTAQNVAANDKIARIGSSNCAMKMAKRTDISPPSVV